MTGFHGNGWNYYFCLRWETWEIVKLTYSGLLKPTMFFLCVFLQHSVNIHLVVTKSVNRSNANSSYLFLFDPILDVCYRVVNWKTCTMSFPLWVSSIVSYRHRYVHTQKGQQVNVIRFGKLERDYNICHSMDLNQVCNSLFWLNEEMVPIPCDSTLIWTKKSLICWIKYHLYKLQDLKKCPKHGSLAPFWLHCKCRTKPLSEYLGSLWIIWFDIKAMQVVCALWEKINGQIVAVLFLQAGQSVSKCRQIWKLFLSDILFSLITLHEPLLSLGSGSLFQHP